MLTLSKKQWEGSSGQILEYVEKEGTFQELVGLWDFLRFLSMKVLFLLYTNLISYLYSLDNEDMY